MYNLTVQVCCVEACYLCSTENSCKGRCGETFMRGRLCSCDSECVKYKQCCSDYKTHCDAEGTPVQDIQHDCVIMCRLTSIDSLHGFSLSSIRMITDVFCKVKVVIHNQCPLLIFAGHLIYCQKAQQQ